MGNALLLKFIDNIVIVSLCIFSAHARETCLTKKKIIVDVDTSGLGNRLLGLTSSILLATPLDRLLYLKWERTSSCGSKFYELFITKQSEAFPSNVFFPDITYNATGPMVALNTIECRVRFSQHGKFLHFWFLKDPELLRRLDASCEVIHILTNQYYAPILFDHPTFGDMLLQKFSSMPFMTISKCHFRVRHRIVKEAKELVAKKGRARWLGIHTRGLYDSGKGVASALKCAQSLLASGAITHVFYATESAAAEDMAKHAISSEALILTKKTLIPPGHMQHEGHYIRNEMENAMKEWYLLGSADYCMATTMNSSTFSQTALSHGNCKYINYRQASKW